MPDIVATRVALMAGHQASSAAAELARFNSHGEGLHGLFEGEICEWLADALKLTLQMEQAVTHSDERNQLIGALERFLDGWAG